MKLIFSFKERVLLKQCLTIAFASLVQASPCSEKPAKVYFNSPAHCGQGNTHEVKPTQGYHVLRDIADDKNTESFMECEMLFKAENENGNICLIQEGRLSHINDDNAQLIIGDGNGEDTATTIHLLKSQSQWYQREYCTNTSYLYLHMKKWGNSQPVNGTLIDTRFTVLDVQSHERTLYLDYVHCDHEHILKNSLVNVHETLPPSFREEDDDGKEKRYCGLKFKRISQETKACIAYIPSPGDDCTVSWEFGVVINQFDLPSVAIPANVKWRVKCKEAREMKTWCGSMTEFNIILDRKDVNDLERTKMNYFSLIVTDLAKSEEDLKPIVKEHQEREIPCGTPQYRDPGTGSSPSVANVNPSVAATTSTNRDTTTKGSGGATTSATAALVVSLVMSLLI